MKDTPWLSSMLFAEETVPLHIVTPSKSGRELWKQTLEVNEFYQTHYFEKIQAVKSPSKALLWLWFYLLQNKEVSLSIYTFIIRIPFLFLSAKHCIIATHARVQLTIDEH